MNRDPERRDAREVEGAGETALREQLERLAAHNARLEAELAASEGRLPARTAAPPGFEGQVGPFSHGPRSLAERRRWTGRAIRAALLALGIGVGLYFYARMREAPPEERRAAAIEAAAEAQAEAAEAAAEAAAEVAAEAAENAAVAAEQAAEQAAAQAAAQADANARARANRARPDGPPSNAPAPPP
jgi:hypothetical protein